MYERLGSISAIDETLESIRSAKSRIQLFGVWCKTNSVRMRVLSRTPCACADCGIPASFVAVERTLGAHQTGYHINVYAIDANGKEVMLTHDHVIPKSKGGPSTLENGQVLCSRCNFKKADTLPDKDMIASEKPWLLDMHKTLVESN